MDAEFSIEQHSLNNVPLTVSITTTVLDWRRIRECLRNNCNGSDLSALRVHDVRRHIEAAIDRFADLEKQVVKVPEKQEEDG